MTMRFKDWVITMQEDAENMNYVEFISEYGISTNSFNGDDDGVL